MISKILASIIIKGMFSLSNLDRKPATVEFVKSVLESVTELTLSIITF